MKSAGDIFRIGIFILMLVTAGCGTKKNFNYQRTGQVEFVKQEDPQTITVRSTGFGSNSADASYFAEKNAIENILFKGIPGSNLRQPMIPDELDAMAKHPKRLKDLITSKYKEYVIFQEVISKDSGPNGVAIEKLLKFDIGALRKYLETSEVIRSFGY